MTVSIIGIDQTREPMNIARFDPAKYAVALEPYPVNGGGKECVLQRIEGDPRWPTSIRIGHYPAQGVGKATNISIKYSTFSKDDGGEEDVYSPFTITIATGSQGVGGVPDVADFIDALTNALSFFLPDVTGENDDPVETVVNSLKYGIVDNYTLGS